METKVVYDEKPELDNPVLIEGLPGIGNVGRVSVKYLIDHLEAKKFATLYSPHFLPFVLINEDSTAETLKMQFYYWKAKKKNQKDMILVTGISQSATPEGHYETTEAILEVAEEFGCSSVITTGGLQTGEIEEKPEVIGVGSNADVIKKYKDTNIKFEAGDRVGTIVGASGLILGMAEERNIEGVCLLGETSGLPIVTDPKSAEAVIEVLCDMLSLDVNLDDIEEKVKEMEAFIKKIGKLQKKALQQLQKKTEGDDLKYIG